VEEKEIKLSFFCSKSWRKERRSDILFAPYIRDNTLFFLF
jgi:hypothetical protein